MPEPPFELAAGHRWFAIEANNAAWDLVEAPARGREETERMLHLAHAACWHWSEAGGPLQRMRALNLLAAAYLAAEDAAGADCYSAACLTLCRELEEEASPFDRACAWGCRAAAHKLTGSEEAAQAVAECERELAALPPDDAGLVRRLYGMDAPA